MTPIDCTRLVGCEQFTAKEENNLGSSREIWRKSVARNQGNKSIANRKLCKEGRFQDRIEQKLANWRGKMYGQFVMDMNDKTTDYEKNIVTDEESRPQSRTEALRPKYVENKIDKTADSSLCRLCGDVKNWLRENKKDTRIMLKLSICEGFSLDRTNKLYKHSPQSLTKA